MSSFGPYAGAKTRSPLVNCVVNFKAVPNF